MLFHRTHCNGFRCTSSLLLRTRGGKMATVDDLRRAVFGTPKSQLHQTPPAAVSLMEAARELPEIGYLQTERKLWSSESISSAWKEIHQTIRDYRERDPARAEEIEQKDLKGLAWCTAHAEIQYLMEMFSPRIREEIRRSPEFSASTVEEFFIHLGQDIEVRGDTWMTRLSAPSIEDLQYSLKMFGKFGEDGRGCIESTAHRVSVWRGRRGESLGVTVRVGRYVPSAAKAILPLVSKGNALILSKAGMGKTTLLRDLAASIANSEGAPRVVVVDTSSEIGGDGPIPMPFLGRCRRIQVPRRELLSQIMAEAIQNHSPEYLIVDELVSATEAEAAWSISQRGVRLIATCHGETLEGLLQNQSLKLLVGGTAHAFLSNEERRLRNKEKKTVLERPYNSPFHFVVEIQKRNSAFVFVNVNKAVDLILDDKKPKLDSSVGDRVDLLGEFPSRLEKLLNNQLGKGVGGRHHNSPKDSRNDESSNNTSQKMRGSGKNKKSDIELYNELSGFL